MSISHIKKIQNDIDDIEKESDKFISPDKYYIIYLRFPNETKDLSLDITKKLGKIFLNHNPNHQPLANYVFEDELYLIFSPLQDASIYYLGGSYQKLLSEHVSYFSNYLKCGNVKCAIIEFASQIQIITYFTLRIYVNSRRFILGLLNDKLSEDDISSRTLSELTEELKNYNQDWENIPNENKFGIFLKLKNSGNKIVISTLSECFDARNNQRYINYIFG